MGDRVPYIIRDGFLIEEGDRVITSKCKEHIVSYISHNYCNLRNPNLALVPHNDITSFRAAQDRSNKSYKEPILVNNESEMIRLGRKGAKITPISTGWWAVREAVVRKIATLHLHANENHPDILFSTANANIRLSVVYENGEPVRDSLKAEWIK